MQNEKQTMLEVKVHVGRKWKVRGNFHVGSSGVRVELKGKRSTNLHGNNVKNLKGNN